MWNKHHNKYMSVNYTPIVWISEKSRPTIFASIQQMNVMLKKAIITELQIMFFLEIESKPNQPSSK
jgi:hypothetical protein